MSHTHRTGGPLVPLEDRVERLEIPTGSPLRFAVSHSVDRQCFHVPFSVPVGQQQEGVGFPFANGRLFEGKDVTVCLMLARAESPLEGLEDELPAQVIELDGRG